MDEGAEFDADEEGTVSFSAMAEDESGEPSHFVLKCDADGRLASFPIALRASDTATAEMPSPAPRTTIAPKGSHVRAALREDEALAMTEDELRQGGYPPPPDVQKAPAAYARWLRILSRPATVIPPPPSGHRRANHAHARPPRGPHAPTTEAGAFTFGDPSWTGYVLSKCLQNYATCTEPVTYDYVDGDWVVPTVQAVAPFNFWESSVIWVGIDGYDTTDLLQTGTEQRAVLAKSAGRAPYRLHHEFQWTEVYPAQPITATNLPVSGGDEVFCHVWTGDSSTTTPAPNGAYADFTCDNLTTGQSQTVRVALGPLKTKVYGRNAEWILEIPYESGVSKPRFPYFDPFEIYDPAARRVDNNPTWVSFDDANVNSVQMILINSDGTYPTHHLDAVAPIDGNRGIQFTWLASR